MSDSDSIDDAEHDAQYAWLADPASADTPSPSQDYEELADLLRRHVPDAMRPVVCPAGEHKAKYDTQIGPHPRPTCGRCLPLWEIVIHLNDRHRIPREQVADWMDELAMDGWDLVVRDHEVPEVAWAPVPGVSGGWVEVMMPVPKAKSAILKAAVATINGTSFDYDADKVRAVVEKYPHLLGGEIRLVDTVQASNPVWSTDPAHPDQLHLSVAVGVRLRITAHLADGPDVWCEINPGERPIHEVLDALARSTMGPTLALTPTPIGTQIAGPPDLGPYFMEET